MMNWSDKTLFVGDNLHVLRGMNSETVDLIYLDPPFNSNRSYAAPIGSQAAGAAFKDAWTLSDVDLMEHQALKENHPGLFAVIDAAGRVQSKGMKSYLIMMAVRLLELRRLLKETGSLYLHCDPTASHYLKLACDAIFGAANFRSEIVWRRSNSHNKTNRQYGPIHEIILFYCKSQKCTFHPGTRPYAKAYIENRFTKEDERGRYQTNYLTGPGQRNGESGEEWRGFDPTAADRHWAIPRSLREFLPDQGKSMTSHEKLECLYKQDLIVFPKKVGGQPMYKQYVGEGVPYQDIWAYQPNTRGALFNSDENIDQDVKWLEAEAERVGYPTQKPLGLLERIIHTSSDEGDAILDPFCGCATTLVAADRLRRRWVGIDLSARAGDLVKERIEADQGHLFRDIVIREDIPQRTDLEPPLTAKEKREYKKTLYGLQMGYCNGCNEHFQIRNLHMDHITARARGGTDHAWNFQLLCGACNSEKGTKTQAEFQAEVAQRRNLSWLDAAG